MTNVEKVMEMNKEGKPDWEVMRCPEKGRA
jgi:hypothetical protein